MAKDTNPTQTIAITNFSGRLTRILNGDLNSGFAKYSTSFGYDPFSKPMNLTWLEDSINMSGFKDLVLDGKVTGGIDGDANVNAYLMGSKNNLYKVQVNSTTNNSVHSVVAIYSVLAGNPTFNNGASMEIFGGTPKLFIGSDTQVNSINFDGSGDAAVGSSGSYKPNIFRPLTEIAGNLVFGNGQTVGEINATGTVISSIISVGGTNIYSALNPPLPSGMKIHDLDVSQDNNYVLMTASEADYPAIANTIQSPDLSATFPAASKVFYWNGVDPTVTAGTNIATNQATALQSYLQKNHIFASDLFGSGLYAESEKILTLTDSKSPFANATGVNGQFLFWSTYAKRIINGVSVLRGTMYYYGSLDQENPAGLYRLFFFTPPLINGNTIEMPFNTVVSTGSLDLNPSQSSVVSAGLGTHYMSYAAVANTGSSVLGVRRLTIPGTGSGSPQFGLYETQTQLFSKRVGPSQIRVYTEPTVAGNAFQIDLISTDGNVIPSGTFTYNFGDIQDTQTGSNSVQRINFNPDIAATYGLGIRITNLGSTNMTIKKIELDYTEEGK